MRNKMQIDEFVRQEVLHKDAQLNIGAWSNMERMLNGENPYATSPEPETDVINKKTNTKRLLSLLLLLVAISSTALFTTFKNKNKNTPNLLATANNVNVSTAKTQNNEAVNSINNTENTTTLSTESNTQDNAQNIDKTTAIDAIEKTSSTTNISRVTTTNSQEFENQNSQNAASEANAVVHTVQANSNTEVVYTTPIAKNAKRKYTARSQANSLVNTDNENNFVQNNSAVMPKISNKKLAKGNKELSVTQTNEVNISSENVDINAVEPIILKHTKKVKSKKNVTPTAKNNVTQTINEENIANANTVHTKTDVNVTAPQITPSKQSKQAAKQLQKQQKKQQQLLLASQQNAETKDADALKATINKTASKTLDSTTKIVVNRKTTKGARGKLLVQTDTIGVYKTAIEPKIIASENAQDNIALTNQSNVESKNNAVSKLSVAATNPRYLPNASKAKTAKATAKQTINENNIEPKAQTAKAATSPSLVQNVAQDKARDDKKKPRYSALEMAMANVLKNAIESIRKLGYIKILNNKITVNPGIFAGINASGFNKDDFGGYHFGTTALIQIARNLNLMPGLTFFTKNNSGYSVRDNAIQISQQSAANQYSPNWYAYQAKYDSTVYVHNFKRIYSLEAPIALQYNFKNFALYGGVNLSYNFKIKTTSITKGYGLGASNLDYLHDTIYSTTPPQYTYPASRSTFYKSPDFNSRFGVGYAAGVNYHFTPKFYVDCKVTQNIWDNSSTVSSAQISKKVFMLPSFQLSLGYRFRDNSE